MTKEKITTLAKNLKAKEVHSADGMILSASDSGPIKAIEFNEGSIYMIPSKKKKKDASNEAKRVQCWECGRNKITTETIFRNSQRPTFDAWCQKWWSAPLGSSFEVMVCADGDFICAAEVIDKSLFHFRSKRMVLVAKALISRSLLLTKQRGERWTVSTSNGNLFISHRQGIPEVRSTLKPASPG